MNPQDIKKLVQDEIKKFADFLAKKINSAPAEANDVVNKNYVDNLKAYGQARGTTTVANASATLMTLSNDFAVGITWDANNHKFVCVTAGYYLVTAMISITTATVGAIYQALIYQGGTGVAGGTATAQASLANNISASVSYIVNLAVGQDVELYGNHNIAGGGNEVLVGLLTIQKIN